MAKSVAFIADSLDNARKFQQAFSSLALSVAAGSTIQLAKILDGDNPLDLIVFEARGNALPYYAQARASAEDRGCPLLVIVNEAELDQVPLPAAVPSDFIVHGAGIPEITLRVERLISKEEESQDFDRIEVDGMVINLATYQVSINGEPVDFTYLEYALLSFLAKHPGHTFSRDALLQRVWGFDYYGGSRTVDVHVRRIRSKLGPELAQRLETVRGVGYLWNS